MRIVFMGTPDYSVASLKGLVTAGHDIVGVFVQPDKPVGRKRIMTAPPVKVCAGELGLTVYQPESMRDGAALELLRELKPDVIVVVAYGKILPKEILELPRFGCVNGHASLLPKYRGASPIQWCIVCGETVTGITIQRMDEGVDTGDILAQRSVEIGDSETAEQLFERLSLVSAELMTETLEKLEKGEIIPQSQDEALASHAPILKKEMAQLDFTKTARELYNAVRGYYSWPCAFFFLGGKRIKVIESRIGDKTSAKAGEIIACNGRLSVACGDGVALEILKLQPEGKGVMSAADMLKGHSISSGTMVD